MVRKMDDLISRQKALDHLRKRLIQTANNNVGFVCDAGSTFQDASERVKTWLDELPSIDAVPVQDGILKARKGDYVTYRIDWLLDHLAQEISLLEGYRRGRKEDG